MLGVTAIIGVLAALTFVMFTASQKTAENIQVQAAVGRVGKSALPRKTPPLSWRDNEHIVIFKPGTTNPKAQAQRLAGLCSGQVLNDYFGPFLGCALKIADGTLDILTADPVVALVQKNNLVHTCYETVPTGIRRIKVNIGPLNGGIINSPIHNIKSGGPSNDFPVIAIVDTGVDYLHPDLHVVFNKGFGQPDFGDQFGHGTHCAGIAAAIHNDIGVVGVAPGAPIWNIRVLGADGSGADSEIIDALQFLASKADQVSVISMSLGGPGVDPALNLAVDYCVSQGQVVCVAAGNSSMDAATFSPASAPSAICVAALADSDGLPGGLGPVTVAGPDDTFATFSNWGTTVTVIAPGVQILSTFPTTGSVLGVNYGSISGTSMACPHVAGLAARMRPTTGGPKIHNIIPPVGTTLTPAAVLHKMLAIKTEDIPCIYDSRTYPLITALGQ